MKKTRAEKALPKNGPTKRVGSGRLVLRSVVQRVNDLLLVKNATGVSAVEICNVVADAIGDRINAESSSPEFRPFFLNIDRNKARELLGLPQNIGGEPPAQQKTK